MEDKKGPDSLWSTPDTTGGSGVKLDVGVSEGDFSKTRPRSQDTDALNRIAQATEATAKRIAQIDSLSRGGDNQAVLQALTNLGESFRAESTYGIFVGAELYQAPINLQVDTFPPRWFQELDSTGQDLIRARIRLANAAFIKRRVADIDPEKAKNNDYLLLPWREMELLYKEMPGFREALEIFYGDLFEARYEDANFSGIRLKQGSVEKLKNFLGYRDGLIKKLVKEGHSEIEAKAAVAVAWNLIYIGNTVESADINREVAPSIVYGEQVRANCHPLIKGRRKLVEDVEKKDRVKEVGTEEGWGGQLGVWIAERVSRDPKFKDAFLKGEFNPFPETMLISFFENETDKDKITLAERLLKREEINFNPDFSGADMFGDYVDLWDTALKGYFYATGKVPLAKFDRAEVMNWTAALADVMAKMKGEQLLKRHYLTPDYLLFCICASVGLKSRTSDLVLDMPNQYYNLNLRALLNPRLLAPFPGQKVAKSYLVKNLSAGFMGSQARWVTGFKRIWEIGTKP